MYSNNSPRRMRRFTFGAVLAVLALLLTPALLGQAVVEAGPVAVHSAAATQGAPEALGPASAAQDGALHAPAAFSDALAAAPAGAQCNMSAHSCSVPSGDSGQSLTSGETSVAFGFSQSLRSGAHSGRL